MADQVKEMLHVLGEFKTRMSENRDRLHDLASQVVQVDSEQAVDPRAKFDQALNAAEARATRLDREIADVELMLKNWLNTRPPPDHSKG